jgi:hypothetical protein
MVGGKEAFPWLTFSLCALLPASLIDLTTLPWYGAIPLSLVLCFLLILGVAIYFEENNLWDYDPWKSQDKSCLKCGKITFDATKADEKWAIKQVAIQIRKEAQEKKITRLELQRQANKKNAKSRYENMLELRAKAQ